MNQVGTEPWSIQRLLTWTADYFQRQQRDSPRLAAEVLLAEALGCRRIELYTRYDEVPAEPALSRYREWVRRHAAGEPVAYLVGHKDFYSLRFRVTPAVLIPRPESELLVLESLQILKTLANPNPLVIDVGTGSGCLAIAIARHAVSARFLAVDLSPAALQLAKENADALGVSDRVEFRQSDLLDSACEPSPDLIVSNPPYVGQRDQGKSLDRDVQKYEPAEALFGGAQGSELSERLIREAAQCLRPGGWLIFETSPMLATHLAEYITAQPVFDRPQIKKDLSKLDRAVLARKRI